jgi:surface polysaccharide O-acyltransferase-like enzyme
MLAVQTRHSARWYWVPLRVFLVTFILGLIAFAVALFVGISGVLVAAKLRSIEPDMAIAYRDVALPSAAIVATITLFISAYVEIRAYRRSKTLEGIEHQMRT